MTGAGAARPDVPGPAANAGAARTETASSAAEIVLNMCVLLKGIGAVPTSGLADHVTEVMDFALNPS